MEWVLADPSKQKRTNVLDMGTGSVRLLFLERRAYRWAVVGADISEEALAVAKENAQL